MKQINKGREPKLLEEHRAKGGNFDGLNKDKLRKQMFKEQGYICCYCMRRIYDEQLTSTKIEHVKSQKNHPELELVYQNLLLACKGNEGKTKIMQTCDTSKGENDLSFNPADKTKNIENFIKYTLNCEIHSDNPIIDRELEKVLNLNTLDLKKIRAEFYKNVNDKIKEEGKRNIGKGIPIRFFEEEKQKLLTKLDGKFPEYCMIGVYLFNKKLNKIN